MSRQITEIRQLYNSIEGLFRTLDNFPKVKESLLASKIIIEYELQSPAGRMLIDASGDDIKVYTDEWPENMPSHVKLTMTSDTCHLYWLGEVNFMFASFNGNITTEGDLGMLLKLGPLAKPLNKIYAEYLDKNGVEKLSVR